MIHRKDRDASNNCSHCGKKLSAWDKARSKDFKLMKVGAGYPNPLCVASAYFLAAKFVDQNLGDPVLRGGFNARE